MDAGSAKVSGVESVAEAAAHALEEIVAAVEGVRSAATDVAREARADEEIVDGSSGERTAEAGSAANDNASASEEVTAAAEEQSASTEEMAAAAAELLQASNRLARPRHRIPDLS